MMMNVQASERALWSLCGLTHIQPGLDSLHSEPISEQHVF